MAEIPFSKTQLDQLQSVCASDSRLLAVFLFGSQLDGYALPQSDVDLGILLAEKLALSERLALEVRLCQAVGREDLDIISLSEAPISIRFRAIAGRLLYERTPDLVSDFMQRTMLEYYDFQHILKIYEREFAHSLERDYGL